MGDRDRGDRKRQWQAMKRIDVSRETSQADSRRPRGIRGLRGGVGTEDRICRSGDHEGGGMFHVKQCGQANPITARDRGASG